MTSGSRKTFSAAYRVAFAKMAMPNDLNELRCELWVGAVKTPKGELRLRRVARGCRRLGDRNSKHRGTAPGVTKDVISFHAPNGCIRFQDTLRGPDRFQLDRTPLNCATGLLDQTLDLQ